MDIDLSARTGLPADLLELLALFPRDGWQGAPAFHPLASFWLDRHLGFRRMFHLLITDAQAMTAGDLDAEDWRRRTSRLGQHLVGDLLGHHQIEDDAYFPEMVRLEPRLARGFDILDADHHGLDGLLDGFVRAANAGLSVDNPRDGAGSLLAVLHPFQRQLVQHLGDEEDLIIPVILKHRMG